MAKKKQVDTIKIQKAVEEAERMVSGVKDDKLRPIAFRAILDVLLAGKFPTTTGKTKNRKGKPKSDAQTGKTSKGKGVWKLLGELVEEGFFEEERTLKEVLAELKKRGYTFKSNAVSGPLVRYTKKEILSREEKAPPGSEKKIWHYSNYKE